MLLTDRRAIIISNVLWTFLVSNHNNNSNNIKNNTFIFTLEAAAHVICSDTPKPFRQAVWSSGGHFLYRGSAALSSTNKITVEHPPPDLLLPNTYDDPKALTYFQCLERQLDPSVVVARPSTGHVGTSNVQEAAQWGSVVSVWPLGSELSYLWPLDRQTLFPGQCPDRRHDLVCNVGLSKALAQRREVLFASWYDDDIDVISSSAFVSVPFTLDVPLKDMLERLHYGL
jgi:hypothetical protein